MRLVRFALQTLCYLSVISAFSLATAFGEPRGIPPGLKQALEAQTVHTERLMAHPGVIGTGVGISPTGTAAVTVFTEHFGVGGLPNSLNGVPVQVKVTGTIRALNNCTGSLASDPVCDTKGPAGHGNGGGSGGSGGSGTQVDPTSRFTRPVPIGISVGTVDDIQIQGIFISCSAGTLGARLTNGSNVYVLSNNHVLAGENNDSIGNQGAVVQPGPADTNPVCSNNQGTDSIGTLDDFEPIVFTTTASNTIDAAIAVSSTGNLGKATPSDGYGIPLSTVEVCDETVSCGNWLGLPVQKYGRTSGLTTGTISEIHVVVDVQYNSGTAQFVDQIVVSGGKSTFIQSGDSGSLLVGDPDRKPVGLLFAGDRRGKTGFANRIDLVLGRFGLSVDGE